MHSIRVKITAATIAAIIISVLALGFIAVFTIGVESDEASTEKMQLISENAQKSLDGYLNSLKQSVDMADFVAEDSLSQIRLEDYNIPNASSRAVNQTPEQAQKLDEFLTSHFSLVRSAFGSVANSTSGVEEYYYCINANLGSSSHGFFYSKVGLSDFQEQPPINSHNLDPREVDRDIWYFAPIQAGSPVWVGPYRDRYHDDASVISYVVPTYKDNTLIGVIGMDILMETLVSQISSIQVYDTGFACLLDQDGHILYHPDMEEGSVPQAIDDLLSSGVFQQESSNGEMIRYNVDGEERQLAFSTLTNGMKVVVAAPVSEIAASQRTLTELISVIASIILVIFTVFILVVMDAITDPLKRLTAASRKLASGDYDVELDYDGKDEVGVLTDSFRQMRDELRTYITDLNSRASTDALTGVRNKGAYDALVAKIDGTIDASGEGEPPKFGLIVLDCNDLKQINDEYGHANGDVYLQSARRVICRVFAHSAVFRIGGDEFAVVLQGEDFDNRGRLLDAFDEMVEEVNAVVSEPWKRVNIAKGVATFTPGQDKSVEDVFNRADERMYEDKQQYRRRRDRAAAEASADNG
ncbi:MAG: diguanylate cyclase [Eggerthellaceae bacterium]|nr:diguanylate cyclase [Eggerthellaceae bacterium]